MPAESPQFDVPLTFAAQMEARSQHPEVAERVALEQGVRTWTYRQLRDESVRYGHFLLQRSDTVSSENPRHVAVMLENHLELLALYGGCAFAGATLFGVNTGLRGETLAGVINQSRSRLLVVDQKFLGRIDEVQGELAHISPENVLILPTLEDRTLPTGRVLEECISAEVAKSGESLPAPEVKGSPEDNLMVIYTSGTTGLPKGINNNNLKLLTIGAVVAARLELTPEDCGYACMPLYHSNAMFLGFHPAFQACGRLVLRERFSASGFVPDLLRYGITYWNYVGEPVHYILSAIESEYGGDEARIRSELTEHPDNRLHYALGNGAAPPDIDRFIRWLGLEDMFELYGSTEAAISCFRKKTDPRGSVGEIGDPAVKIVGEDGVECPPAQIDGDGKITNYAEAVGEICRVAEDTALFQGYFDQPEANASKFRDGVYHSGDLGHVLEQDGRRFLYFDGRTDDWIRKDGENFSAAQVARLFAEHPDVVLGAAYGVPCAVSDELVMVALKLRAGARFDPQGLFHFCEKEIRSGGMDPKWFPDFVRVVEEFEYTETQKILVRHLKQQHFDPRRLTDDPVFWRRRGDTTFHRFTPEDYEALRQEFVAAERIQLLDR